MCWNKRCVNPEHLRVVTNKQNSENVRGASTRSTTGIRGVYRRGNGKYRATVTHHYEVIEVGLFNTLEEAEEAVVAKRNELFTHNSPDRRDIA
jgi:hypothetical protein